MYLNKLTNLLIPPNNVDSISIKKNIKLVEERFDFKFPEDFIKFSTNYGAGQINEFISIYSAINSTAYYEMIEKNCQYYRDFKKEFPDEYKHSIFPEDGGLFPLGRTDGGSLMWWHTASKAENWFIVVYDENSWDYEEYNMQLCEFIYKYFTKQIECEGFPDSLREEKLHFVANSFDFKKSCN